MILKIANNTIYSDDITLIALGPLTNLAMAMRLDEQFASNLKELYIMGGNVEGNYTTQTRSFEIGSKTTWSFQESVILPCLQSSTSIAIQKLLMLSYRIQSARRI